MKFNQNNLETLKGKLSELEKVNLAYLPTPLHEAPNLSNVLNGPKIFFKREDLTGMAFGGNKTRMFEYVLAKIVKEGYDTIIAGAAVQSNYCRQMAAGCAKLGLDCYLLLRPVRGDKDYNAQGNLLLDLLMDAKVTILKKNSHEYQISEAEKLAEKLRNEGRKPFIARAINEEYVGFDGAAYVDCMIEICQQVKEQDLNFNYIYASTLDTTHTGLLFGAEYVGVEVDIRAINPVDTNFMDWVPEKKVMQINREICKVLGIDFTIKPNRIFSISDYIGDGYGMMTDGCREAIKLVARTEGIFLDPVYSGKAMAGLIDHIRKGKLSKEDTVLFIHTGGTPALFAYADELDIDVL
jgi:D-cysteine desulfhydrase family pyridoxal phosphate-dependent enzyme